MWIGHSLIKEILENKMFKELFIYCINDYDVLNLLYKLFFFTYELYTISKTDARAVQL